MLYDYQGNIYTGKYWEGPRGKKYRLDICFSCSGTGRYSYHGICWKGDGSGKGIQSQRYDLRLYESQKDIERVLKARKLREEKKKAKEEKELPLKIAKAEIRFFMSLLKDTIALSQITKPLNEQKFFDGQKSKRYEFVATLKKRIELDTQWGVSVLFIFVTDLEETLSMFYSGYKFDCEENDKIKFSANIKDFEIYKNRTSDIQTKQTVLSRPKFIERIT